MKAICSLSRLSAFAVAAAAVILVGSAPVSAGTLFFDDFSGPALNPAWQASLPAANINGPPPGTYLGAPSFAFQTLSGASVLRMTETLNAYQRRGWSTATSFTVPDFRYEARFNTLNQSASTSIDAFMEIWVLDAANPGRYDKVCLFGGDFSSSRMFTTSSSIGNSSSSPSFNYQNNTWYRLVLEGAPGQNIRASLCNDSGTELIGQTFNHGVGAYGSGFEIALSQAMGDPYTGSGPSDVAVDFVKLTVVPEPSSAALLCCALAGGLFSVRRGRAGSAR